MSHEILRFQLIQELLSEQLKMNRVCYNYVHQQILDRWPFQEAEIRSTSVIQVVRSNALDDPNQPYAPITCQMKRNSSS